MRYQQLIEGRDAPLYHGVAHRNAIQQLQQDFIQGLTNQRFWPDGRRLRDNHLEYEDSFWLRGISTTRDQNYAKDWADVVYVLDQSKLTQRYKVIPYNWGYSNSRNNKPDPKREREEFIVLGKHYTTMQKFIDDHNDRLDDIYDELSAAEKAGDQGRVDQLLKLKKEMGYAMDKWNAPPKMKLQPLSNYLLGIYADQVHKTLDAKNIEVITKHPLFKGYF